MRNADVSTKEAYLAWVVEWKREWHGIVGLIRNARVRKNEHRDRARHGRAVMDPAAAGIDIDLEEQLMHSAWGSRLRYGYMARVLIEQRHEGKRLSWEARCKTIKKEEVA